MKYTVSNELPREICDWCDRRKDCVEVTIDGTFFKHSSICQKCLRKIVAICRKQEQQNVVDAAIEKT